MSRIIHDNRIIAIESDTMFAAAAPAAQQYTVNFVNNSNNPGTAYMYQTDPGLVIPAPASLAWFAYGSNPGVTNTFMWSIQYSMIWSTTATLVPGVVVIAAQNLPCGLTSSNEATFSKNQFGFLLSGQTTGSPSGSIIIAQDNSIPAGTASIGIGMSGAGTFAIPAQPNITAIFTPNPTYWISFSLAPVQQGTVLITQSTNSAMIQFPPNLFTCTATLNSQNQWILSYS